MHGAAGHGFTAVGWLLVAVCALAACGCLVRARSAEPIARQVACGEAVMGFGMATMALPGGLAQALPPEFFVPLFCAAGVWELVLLCRRWRAPGAAAHHLHHLTGAAAMAYMAALMTAAPMGAASAGWPPLTAALLVYFAAYVLWAGLRLLPLAAEREASAPVGVTAGVTAGVASGVTARVAPVAGTEGLAEGSAGGVTGGPAGAGCHAGGHATGRTEAGLPHTPGLATACRLAMGTGMLAMLLTA